MPEFDVCEFRMNSTPAFSIQWSGHTDVGRVRKNNEDSFLCLQFDSQEVRFLGREGEASLSNADALFAVSDGMGGAMAGEFASKIAVEKITRLLPRSFQVSAAGIHPGFEDILTELFHQIHKALLHLGASYEECSGMGTTLTLGWFTPGWLYFAHVGDSRIYYSEAGSNSLKQLSHDDSHVGWLFRNGKITEREARNHPRRTALSKALGAGHQFVDPQIGAVGYTAGDAFFLCTDGVTDGLFKHQIERVLFDPEPVERELQQGRRVVRNAVENSGKDNTTALFVEILGQ